MKLIIASNNDHKLKEINQIMGVDFELITPSMLGIVDDIPETGVTFAENALQKARYLYMKNGIPVLADDSGLEVEALNGQPGVFSARYAGPARNSEKNIDLLLDNLKDCKNRNAQFKTVIALVMDDNEYLFDGIVAGEILWERRGNAGFGYDSVFLPKGQTLSFAQMTDEQKNALSHRGNAMKKVKDFLLSLNKPSFKG
jgi:XTP/dITP diphosphohydrolase